MNADVIDLDSRRPPSTCGCRAGSVCYPHRLTNLRDLLNAHHYAHEDELLVSREVFDAALAAALDVIRSITTECLPDERTAR